MDSGAWSACSAWSAGTPSSTSLKRIKGWSLRKVCLTYALLYVLPCITCVTMHHIELGLQTKKMLMCVCVCVCVCVRARCTAGKALAASILGPERQARITAAMVSTSSCIHRFYVCCPSGLFKGCSQTPVCPAWVALPARDLMPKCALMPLQPGIYAC